MRAGIRKRMATCHLKQNVLSINELVYEVNENRFISTWKDGPHVLANQLTNVSNTCVIHFPFTPLQQTPEL